MIDAVSDALVACEIPSIADAIDEARSRNANEIWQQNLDVRGLPSGKPFPAKKILNGIGRTPGAWRLPHDTADDGAGAHGRALVMAYCPLLPLICLRTSPPGHVVEWMLT